MDARKFFSLSHFGILWYVFLLAVPDIFCALGYWHLSLTLTHSIVSLVAAKTFYFGVGGDILSFRQLIEKDGVFDVKVVFSAQAFVRREILELTFKK